VDKQTIETYNQLAQAYDDETAGFWESFPMTYIHAFAEQVGSGRVLDVGSGPGRDALLLKGKGLQVICLDASESMVRISTARGLDSLVGDFSNLPFKDASFDGVWAYTSLLHIPKAEVDIPLQEIARVLKPGGIFGLGLIEGEAESYRESSGVTKPRWFSYYTRTDVEDLLRKYGFDPFYFESFKPRSSKYLHFISRRNEKDRR
jgi:ubiquinone/menaquinone biosynthesis C-methylase UbiE